MTLHHESAHSGKSQNPSLSDFTTDGFLPARKVLDRYRISQMTLWRWLRDEEMGFPKPVYLGRYRYWKQSALLRWEEAQGARGDAA